MKACLFNFMYLRESFIMFWYQLFLVNISDIIAKKGMTVGFCCIYVTKVLVLLFENNIQQLVM